MIYSFYGRILYRSLFVKGRLKFEAFRLLIINLKLYLNKMFKCVFFIRNFY